MPDDFDRTPIDCNCGSKMIVVAWDQNEKKKWYFCYNCGHFEDRPL